MDATEVWKALDKWTKYGISWVMWSLGLAMPVILAMLVLKGSKAGLAMGEYVPMSTADYLIWLYLYGMYWLCKKATE